MTAPVGCSWPQLASVGLSWLHVAAAVDEVGHLVGGEGALLEVAAAGGLGRHHRLVELDADGRGGDRGPGARTPPGGRAAQQPVVEVGTLALVHTYVL